MKIKKSFVLLIAGLMAGNVWAHSDAFKPEFVQTLVAPYISVHACLAKDDLDGAKAGAAEFVKAMGNAPEEADAKEEAASLVSPARLVAEAEDIDAARTAFLDLSSQVTTLIKHVGISGDDKLYKAYCPMAFGGKGGAWVQPDKSIANPYYGSQMFRCGSIKEQISGKVEEKEEGHAGHNH